MNCTPSSRPQRCRKLRLVTTRRSLGILDDAASKVVVYKGKLMTRDDVSLLNTKWGEIRVDVNITRATVGDFVGASQAIVVCHI